jgi:hypothetical protein
MRVRVWVRHEYQHMCVRVWVRHEYQHLCVRVWVRHGYQMCIELRVNIDCEDNHGLGQARFDRDVHT